MITRAQIEAASDEMDYIHFREARAAGESEQAIASYFGVRRDALEQRYNREYNVGARLSDDRFCPGGCGRRGHQVTCSECSR